MGVGTERQMMSAYSPGNCEDVLTAPKLSSALMGTFKKEKKNPAVRFNRIFLSLFESLSLFT